MTIHLNGKSIELLPYVPDYYCFISELSNRHLDGARRSIETWIPKEAFDKMNVSIGVYSDEQVNAFAKQEGDQNYIALSVGLMQKIYEESKAFVEHEKLHLVLHIPEDRKDSYRQVLFMFMLHFVVAHEFAHILHGHLRYGNEEKMICEVVSLADLEDKALNWITQLKEYDADSYAAHIFAILMLNQWQDNLDYLKEWFDLLSMAIYLCFRIFAKNSKRDFGNYVEQDFMEYNHPYPGIRMHYTIAAVMDMIGSNKEYDEGLHSVFASGYHIILAYEKEVLETQSLKECYFSIASTEKGVQHLMNLANGWNDMIDEYNKYAYVPMTKNSYIEQMPFILDETGEFLR